jgi:hypothetical protein
MSVATIHQYLLHKRFKTSPQWSQLAQPFLSRCRLQQHGSRKLHLRISTNHIVLKVPLHVKDVGASSLQGSKVW